MAWPPTVDELKLDMAGSSTPGLSPKPDENARLQQTLDAAVAFVERARPEFRYDTTNPGQAQRPEPTADLRLGTLRLAGRWHIRRRSPDGMITAPDFPGSRVTSFDNDIDRLLRIGRHQKPRVG